MLLLTKNKFIYKNKDSFILNITDLTHLKRVDQLKNQNDLLNLMTANASHEMDTPLKCIICLADKIIDQTKSEEKKQMAIMIKNSGSLIHFQVKSLLDRNLFQNNMLTINYGVHNLIEAIRRIITMMREVSTKILDI